MMQHTPERLWWLTSVVCLYQAPFFGMQILVAERGPLLFVFNFSPISTYKDYKWVIVCSVVFKLALFFNQKVRQLILYCFANSNLTCCKRTMQRGWAHAATSLFETSPKNTCANLNTSRARVAVPKPGKYRVAFDSDAFCFGGGGAVAWDADHFSKPSPEKFNNR